MLPKNPFHGLVEEIESYGGEQQSSTVEWRTSFQYKEHIQEMKSQLHLFVPVLSSQISK